MSFCRECNSRMVGVMSFGKDKNEKFDRCNKCFSETKHRKLDEKELNFGEELDKAMRKLK